MRAALGIALVLGALPGVGAPRVHAQASRALEFFQAVSGTLSQELPAEDWTFEGRAGQAISLIALATRGGLDPTLQVIAPDGQTIGENDDLDSLVRDAGLEALLLPADGTYTVRVGHYQSTAGSYELTASPGFARLVRRDSFDDDPSLWIAPGSTLAELAQGRLRLHIIGSGQTGIVTPSDGGALGDFYFQAGAKLYGSPSYAEFGLVFRAQTTPQGVRQSYQFKVNSQGRWTVLYQDASGTFVLQTWTPNRALGTSEWTIGVLAREDSFHFYANGALLGTLTDSRLEAPGAIGLLVGTGPDQPDPAEVLFDNVLVTERLGTTYRGMPLSLAQWESFDPAVITGELAASGLIQPSPARALYVPSFALSSTLLESHISLIGAEQTAYGDFVLGAHINIGTTGERIACGMVFRWQDDRNLDLAYIDTGGGVGLVQAQDAELTTNNYTLSPMVVQGSMNRLVLVVQGDQATLYVNGALVTQDRIRASEGRVGAALLNYEDVATNCLFAEIWVWPLVAPQQ